MSEWVESQLQDVCTNLKAGGTPRSDDSSYYGGDIPFVSIEDMTNAGRKISKTVKRLSIKGLNASAAWLVPEGHILLSMYASIGKVSVNEMPVATNQAILAIKPNCEILNTDFLTQSSHR